MTRHTRASLAVAVRLRADRGAKRRAVGTKAAIKREVLVIRQKRAGAPTHRGDPHPGYLMLVECGNGVNVTNVVVVSGRSDQMSDKAMLRQLTTASV